ncbi:hypothetical protein [Polyangium mundeleinium]|uniref:Uncharacterized protein n=1 Tax=Polyangium mundeleinium TaxID=2995306 RepID=A0ABT5F7P5_9BACT|nr:hypothetical protein [Polyangium mundeleinium]MDC0749639.1 hypothetical protein [Polyangium mundeleinium]
MPNPLEPVALDVLVHDCTSLAHFLVDLPPRARMGMCSEQEGFSEVVIEILTNQASLGDKAGITKSDIEAFQESNHRVAMVDAHLPALKKLVEMMEETRALEDDKRQRQVNAFADSIERRAKMTDDKHLLAKYEKTRTYRSAVARKGVKTRTKSAKANAAEGAGAKAQG